MRTIRPALFAAALLALTAATSFADGQNTGKGTDCSTVAAIRLVAPFNLTQTQTTKVNDCLSRSTYSGTGMVEMASCGVTYPGGQAPQVNARVDLSTTSTINACGDGFTNGNFTLTLLDSSGKATDSISGTLTAVNRNFGELQGILEGSQRYKTGDPGVNHNFDVRFRATFTAAFVDPNGDGVYDTVSVTDAHGVTYIPNQKASGGDHGDRD
jgi:hypothetical protein